MIGFFDSGSGGLSVLKAFRALAPEADVVYFGDIKNAPYGTRSARELEELARAGIAFLKEREATEIVAACNSVSPAMLHGAAGETPMIEMSLPFARSLASRHGQHLLLLATPATVASRLYHDAVGASVSLDALPVAPLAGAIERSATDEEIAAIVRSVFDIVRDETYDGVILGCTHYPLVRDIIERVSRDMFGDRAPAIIDPAEAVAREAAMRFDTKGEGRTAFFISQDSAAFRERVAGMFENRSVELAV